MNHNEKIDNNKQTKLSDKNYEAVLSVTSLIQLCSQLLTINFYQVCARKVTTTSCYN